MIRRGSRQAGRTEISVMLLRAGSSRVILPLLVIGEAVD